MDNMKPSSYSMKQAMKKDYFECSSKLTPYQTFYKINKEIGRDPKLQS